MFFVLERKDDANFECEVEPTSTSYAAFEYMSTTDDDYDPYEVFMRMNTRRTVTGRERAPLAVLPSHSTSSPTLVNNYRHYNFADDDTPVKYPLAIGHIDRRLKQQNVTALSLSIS